jgi:hypothetical protein
LKTGALCGMILLQAIKLMSQRNLKQELCYSSYIDQEYGNDTETIDYDCLIGILTELLERVEQLEKDNELLKSYAWEQ